MVNESGEKAAQPQAKSPRELVSKGVVIRSVLPTDDANILWDISVRAMQSADPRFTTTRNRTHVDFENPYQYHKQRKGDLLVAEVGGNIVGFGGFVEYPEPTEIKTCNMRRLRVDPNYQGLGIGQKIIVERDRLAIKAGYKVARVGTSNKNQAVLHLLQKNGYKIIKETPEPDKGLGPDFIEYQLEKVLVDDKK